MKNLHIEELTEPYFTENGQYWIHETYEGNPGRITAWVYSRRVPTCVLPLSSEYSAYIVKKNRGHFAGQLQEVIEVGIKDDQAGKFTGHTDFMWIDDSQSFYADLLRRLAFHGFMRFARYVNNEFLNVTEDTAHNPRGH